MAPDRPDGGSDFFEKNYDRVYQYVRGMVRDPNEAEDLTQEAFLRAHRQRETLKDPGAVLSWLYRIATHVALDRLRQRKTRDSRQSDADVTDIDRLDVEVPSSEQRLEQEQMSACVQRLLVDLPDTYRSVLLLHDTHGLSAPEIAAALEVSLPTVKIRLHRARLRLKTTLKDGCKFSCDGRGVLVCEPKK